VRVRECSCSGKEEEEVAKEEREVLYGSYNGQVSLTMEIGRFGWFARPVSCFFGGNPGVNKVNSGGELQLSPFWTHLSTLSQKSGGWSNLSQ
jgi:hypothetical protein